MRKGIILQTRQCFGKVDKRVSVGLQFAVDLRIIKTKFGQELAFSRH